MPKGFCRYCDEPFAGDPTVGHPSHMERDCRDEIDGHLRRAVTALASARCALERKTEARRAITKSVRSPSARART